jgi:ferrochelatase
MKRAVLFLNLGGPEKLSDVKGFLYRLFEDPEIIRIKFSPMRKFVAWAISTSRYKTSQQMYAKIGGGSPIRRLTDDQSRGVEELIRKKSPDVAVRTAFTCSAPLVEEVVKDLANQGVTHFLNFPLYPQYSYTTTKGAIDRTREAVHRFAPNGKLLEMGSFPTNPLFLEAHADLIREAMKEFSDPRDERIHLVFSAHSIPKKLVTEEGDPYEKEMNQTVQGVLKILNWKGPWTLSWQSKLGPVEWLGPSTEDVLTELGKRGTKQILVDPIAFVTDHIETLYELDQLLSDTARQSGILEYKRVRGLNNHPKFLKCLADQILFQQSFWE